VVRAANPFFKRGNSSNGGVFASNNNNGNSNDNNTSRAVVVCASGLLCSFLDKVILKKYSKGCGTGKG